MTQQRQIYYCKYNKDKQDGLEKCVDMPNTIEELKKTFPVQNKVRKNKSQAL